ncbi:MAG: chemotaxis-specific protein-glutamate methyltransferase CheB [Prolixibacteraceae bacterium]
MINLLIVEDSRVVSEYLYYIFSKDPQIQVIGNVSNGKKAIEFIAEHKTDVITMDIDMPIMDGLEATRIIMSTTPIPILIVTASRNANEVKTSIEALASGALAILEKPVGIEHPRAEQLAAKLVNMVKLMAGVSVVTRKIKPRIQMAVESAKPKVKINSSALKIPELVAIGVSSGGPNTLQIVFSKISMRFPVPIVVVQHIAIGFLQGLVDWLNKLVNPDIHIVIDGEELLPGHIYFAPDAYHLNVTKKGRAKLIKGEANNGICPSVASLFTSVALEYEHKAMGIILTGMGSDGANELKLMRDSGAMTIAQSKESALIHGMPGVAIQLGAADYVLSAEEISILLLEIEKKSIDDQK